MSNIYLTNEDMELFKQFIPSSEEIVYATYAKIEQFIWKTAYKWNSPLIFTNKHVIFFQIEHKRIKQPIGILPLYTTRIFKNYIHIFISILVFSPIFDEKNGETKEVFNDRWKDFHKILLPHVINSQKEQLKIIETNKNKPEFYKKTDLAKMPYFRNQKRLRKHLRESIPKMEKIMEKIT
ncbi:MAG: hypothetical protein JXA99_16320 [Candidatus Lokiarchaeota archaeon]|nr:hypothetical protein [Candidatus Lokiarchaeota archaeon]